MAYDIYFTMVTDKGEEETDIAFSGLEETEEFGELDIVSGEHAQGRCSWSIEKVMREYSLKHPDVLFTMQCEDSEGSKWIDFYRNGLNQCCQGTVVYEEFDETKFK